MDTEPEQYLYWIGGSALVAIIWGLLSIQSIAVDRDHWTRNRPVVLIRGNQAVYIDGVQLAIVKIRGLPLITGQEATKNEDVGIIEYLTPDSSRDRFPQLFLKKNVDTGVYSLAKSR